jgi:hypothetical protein
VHHQVAHEQATTNPRPRGAFNQALLQTMSLSLSQLPTTASKQNTFIMASLIKSLARLGMGLVKKRKEERLLMVGNVHVGKTTLLYRLKLDEQITAIPTIGFNVETVHHGGWDWTLWDMGGE